MASRCHPPSEHGRRAENSCRPGASLSTVEGVKKRERGAEMGQQQQHSDGIWLARVNCADQGAGRGAGARREVSPCTAGHRASGGKSPQTSAEQMLHRERTTSVGPSDTKNKHGSSSGHTHALVAQGGCKRRLLQTWSMQWHGLTQGSSQTSHFPLLGPGDTRWLEPQRQSTWQTLPDM